MTERVILELPDDTVRRARAAAQRTGRPLEAILTEWLEQASAAAEISPLVPDATYRIYTPFGCEATARSLLDMLQETEDEDKPTD